MCHSIFRVNTIANSYLNFITGSIFHKANKSGFKPVFFIMAYFSTNFYMLHFNFLIFYFMLI